MEGDVEDKPGQHCCMCMVTREWTDHVQLLWQRVDREWKDIHLVQLEYNLLEKLLRKNASQHRASRFYKKLEHVKRLLKKFWRIRSEMHGINEDIPHINAMKQQDGGILPLVMFSVLRNASKPVSSLHERNVPSLEWGLRIARDMFDQIHLVEALIHACYEAARQCSIQLALSFFMPLSVACMAITARIQTLMTRFLQNACRDYTTFVEIVKILPSIENPCNRPLTRDGSSALPEYLHCVIQHGHVPCLKKIDSDGSIDSKFSSKDVRDLFGIYPTISEYSQVNETCLVVEDHGQPVSREEVYATMYDPGKASESLKSEHIPAFDTANVPILTGNEKIHTHADPGLSETEKSLDKSPEIELLPQVKISSSVPVLEKRGTAFIRVGEGLVGSVPRKGKKQSEQESLKSWEEWITSPTSSSADHSGLPEKKRKRRRR